MSTHAIPAGTHDDRLRWAMEASGLGMAIVDLRGHWLEVNGALQCMLGYRADELAGRHVSGSFHPDDLVVANALLAGLLDGTGDTMDTQQRCVHRDGSVVWVQANAGVMRDAKDAPQSVLLQWRDITAQRSAEIALQASASHRAEALDTSQRQQQGFADAVSHDLRAPLRSIESFSALLAARAADRLDEADRDYLHRIRAAAQRMGGLLTGLSEWAGVSRAEFRPGHVDLSLLAEWAGAELQEADPERGAQIIVQPGLVGWGDERLLKQLLAHLLGNAWKFSRGHEAIRIEVSGDREADTLRLRVRDAGIGFDPRYAHKLFEPFQRLHGPDEGGGHGLGLAIAQRIVERHGGRISAESRPDAGATFIVELPAAAAGRDTIDA